MKKKLIITLLSITIAFSGCGNSKEPASNKPDPVFDETIPEQSEKPEEFEAKDDSNSSDENSNESDKEIADSLVSIEPVYEDGSTEKELQDYAVKIIMDNYADTTIESISINENLGTEEDGDYIILARLIWNVKNTASTSQKMLSMYSSDFAARIGMDQSSVKEVAIFWTVPYLDNASAKWSYERVDEGMQLSDNMMDAIFNE